MAVYILEASCGGEDKDLLPCHGLAFLLELAVHRVRFGSFASILACPRHVRLVPHADVGGAAVTTTPVTHRRTIADHAIEQVRCGIIQACDVRRLA
jgi:hypothetical protein